MTSRASGSGRIEAIREAVEAGTYSVEAIDVAEAVLRRWSMVDVVEEFESSQDDASDAAASEAASR